MASPVYGITECGITEQIEALKSHTKPKIIKNVGEFQFIIDAPVPGSKINVKFQLTSGYPEVPATLFIRGLEKDIQNRIISEVNDVEGTLSEKFQFVCDRLLPLETVTPSHQHSEEKQQVKEKQNQRDVSIGEKKAQSKKPPMRTAADVIKRVQWDTGFDREKVIVGYIDRFLGIQEQPFTAFNWVNPADADWMDLNIPEHRIEYFKYDDLIVWEKKTRTDKIFGSTGGEKIEKILSQLQVESPGASASDDTSFHDNRNLGSRSMRSEDSDSDSEELIVCSNVKAVNPLTIKKKTALAQTRPNHFIAIPIYNTEVVGNVGHMLAACHQMSPTDLSSYVMDQANLHVTLCALRIDNENDLDDVSQCLYELVDEYGDVLRQSLRIGGLGSFWNRVLYCQVEMSESLMSFSTTLREKIAETAVKVFDDEKFVPHLTLLKFPPFARHEFSIEQFLASKEANLINNFGEQQLQEVCLFSMERDSDNRYKKAFYASIP